MEITQKEIEQLVAQLNAASQAYYAGEAELMTDYEWDAKFDLLKEYEAKTGIILPNSPTINVSHEEMKGQKEQHEFATLSLAKTKSTADLVKWANDKAIWLSWKLDGLTLVATYDKGKLTKVVTRGNGHIGTNITHLAPAISGILPTITNKGHVVIRGEAVISYQDFERFNLETDEAYANPRNLASGSLTLKDVNQVKARRIQWIPFTLLHSDEALTSWGEQMDFLDAMGFNTIEREQIALPSLDNINKVIDKWSHKVQSSATCPFPVDGLVICYDDTDYAAGGSITGHHATRAGYAFKWQDESAATQLLHIEWSCAASTISPVAVFKPVELEGTTVKRASLCNISECERLGIGDKGTQIEVIKANKIIPKVINVTQTIGSLHIPATCPVCHAATQIVESDNSGTKTLHCSNAVCPAKQLKKFARFVSKEGINIDGMSEQTLQKLINLGWVADYADLFHLSDHAPAFRSLEGFGEKSVNNLLKSVEKARTIDARQLLYALNIPEIGKDACSRLLSAYPLSELIETAVNTTDDAVFSVVDGIGPITSAGLVKWLKDENNLTALQRLLAELEVKQEDIQPKGNLCEGLTFVVTGDVSHFKNRNELKAYIESQGGKVTGSVSKSTNYLINNDINSTSGKNQKAQQLQIPILSEEMFLEKFGDI